MIGRSARHPAYTQHAGLARGSSAFFDLADSAVFEHRRRDDFGENICRICLEQNSRTLEQTYKFSGKIIEGSPDPLVAWSSGPLVPWSSANPQ